MKTKLIIALIMIFGLVITGCDLLDSNVDKIENRNLKKEAIHGWQEGMDDSTISLLNKVGWGQYDHAPWQILGVSKDVWEGWSLAEKEAAIDALYENDYRNDRNDEF